MTDVKARPIAGVISDLLCAVFEQLDGAGRVPSAPAPAPRAIPSAASHGSGTGSGSGNGSGSGSGSGRGSGSGNRELVVGVDAGAGSGTSNGGGGGSLQSVPPFVRLLVQVLIEPYRIQLAHSAVSQWRAILRQRGANGNSTGAVDAAKTTQMITLMTTKLQQRAVGCRFEYYDSAFQSFIPVEVSEYRYANREDADDDSADEELVHQFKLKRLKSLTSKWVELGIDNCRPLASVLSQEGACLVCPAPGTEAHEVLSQWGELRSELPPTGLVWMARALPTSQRAGRVVRVRSG